MDLKKIYDTSDASSSSCSHLHLTSAPESIKQSMMGLCLTETRGGSTINIRSDNFQRDVSAPRQMGMPGTIGSGEGTDSTTTISEDGSAL